MGFVRHMSQQDRFAADERSIDRFFKRYAETGRLEEPEGRGRPRLSTAAQDSVLEKLSLADRKTQLNKAQFSRP